MRENREPVCLVGAATRPLALIPGLDLAEIDPHSWAIHGAIPVDGDVIMAEFDTDDQARIVLDKLPTDRPADTVP